MDNLEFTNAMKGLNTPGEFAHQQKPARNRKTKMAKSEWTEEELREEIVKVITSLVKHYFQSYVPSLNQLDVELRKQVGYWVKGIMSHVKSATYLKGNEELPSVYDGIAYGNLLTLLKYVEADGTLASSVANEAQMGLIRAGFKPTKEWKK